MKSIRCVPIYRKGDAKGNLVALNKKAFSNCYDFLKNKKVILIFPEGSSELERKLRPLKAGTAKIALGAEIETNFTLGLKILPIGLNYTNPSKFREKVTLNIGNPIDVFPYKNEAKKKLPVAFRRLTEEIEKSLKTLLELKKI